MKYVLLVGFNSGVLKALNELDERPHVTVIEEPDLWSNKGLAKKAENFSCIKRVLMLEYQKQGSPVIDLSGLSDIDAVLPGLEYAVPAAASIAAQLGLPGAGSDASSALSNKLRLRRVTSAAGMAAPSFCRVDGADEVERFLAEGPCVLKPAERQASLGVVLLSPGDDVESAWELTRNADEGVQLADRDFEWEYMVERLLIGREFSTEALVSNGQVRFLNVTHKTVAEGPHPVELGHTVSSVAPAEIWHKRAQQLVDAVGFGTGIMHAEWIGDDAHATLVECAGRPPGDKIMDLIQLAWEFDPTEAWVRLLSGENVDFPVSPRRSATIRYLRSDAGRIESVRGVEDAMATEGVVAVEITKSAGDIITVATSSWERPGFVIATGTSTPEAERNVLVAIKSIEFKMEASEK